ncbi:recombinase family protein [Qipengyuania spongiae]|uniref:Recombinase family protein n=1 Tax=Qipengyuania spongiae TaxID=2909673 RepID=A0ABY5SXC7_9SPHN|nr:recombinase family protein [Qipengyuania spongiae]UVI39197.1 recombinase family protein [Qipengyuania spongiae]
MKRLRAAIYTRKSSEEGLDQEFNSLDAQREVCEAYIASQKSEGWQLVRTRYDDGGWSGGTIERPALQQLLAEIQAGRIDIVVVYKVDRLSRSLADFARMVELFDRHSVSFVSVTQAFNTTSSMGRLTLNVLLSFAQFEREVTGERIRDKIAASKAKGMWMGGCPPLGYDPNDRSLAVNEGEAETVRHIFRRYLKLGSVYALHAELESDGIRTKVIQTRNGQRGGVRFGRGNLAHLLQNRIYIGEIVHKGTSYPGLHEAIVDRETFEEVQAMIDAQKRGSRKRTLDRAPLTGILFDALGNRMAPTHARGRGGKRYLYYVSLVAPSDDAARVLRRVPAPNIEELLIELMRSWTARPNAGWPELLRFLRRVELHPEAVIVDLVKPAHEKWAIGGEETCDHGADGVLRITSPVRVLTRGGRTSRIEGSARSGRCRPDRALIAGLRRAHSELASRGVDLAAPKLTIDAARGLGDPYLRKLSGLAFLAPDIQRAILEGRQPAGLNLADLLSMTLPLSWSEQRKLLRIT